MNLMEKLKFILSKRVDPIFNLKMDEKLLHLVGQGGINQSVRFYKNADSVILGKYQCVELEANLNFCRANNIPVLKRISGGGAVFHDKGNLNIAIYIREENIPSRYMIESLKMFSGAISVSLNELGFNSEVGEHGEILINGRKISGCAAAKKAGGFLYHATLLLNVDMKKLHKALSPVKNFEPDRKYVRSNRVATLNLYNIRFVPENVIMRVIFRHFLAIF